MLIVRICRNDDIVIAVMGPTGSGKSKFVSWLTGQSVQVGHELKSCALSNKYLLKYRGSLTLD
jgi:polynucleotide 5'-kinase involved in rRNA processing